MTREKALEVSDLIFKIERYENLIDEIKELPGLYELDEVFGEADLEDQLVAIVQAKLNVFLKDLEENY